MSVCQFFSTILFLPKELLQKLILYERHILLLNATDRSIERVRRGTKSGDKKTAREISIPVYFVLIEMITVTR